MACPAGSVLGSAHNVILWEMLIGVDPLARKGLLRSPSGMLAGLSFSIPANAKFGQQLSSDVPKCTHSFSHFSLESILLTTLTISYHLCLALGRSFGFFCLLFRLFSSNNFLFSVCKLHAFACRVNLWLEVSHWVFGIGDFPYLKAGIQDFIAKWGRGWGLKVCTGCGMRDAENSHWD